MKCSIFKFYKVLFFFLFPLLFSGPLEALGSEFPNGVRPLLLTDGKPLSTFVPEGTLFLNDPETLDHFLKKLEGSPPDWKFLFGSNVDERYDRLFEETEKRDAARIGNATANQSLAFLWEGNLTSYRPKHKGFGVAIGPSQIPTDWGNHSFQDRQSSLRNGGGPSIKFIRRASKETIAPRTGRNHYAIHRKTYS